MYPRSDYEMTQEDLDVLLDACKPTPVMFLSGGTPMGSSSQENANRAWATLGEKMGFDSMTVKPQPMKGTRFFSAVPSENETQREERIAREKEENRLAAIVNRKQQIIALQKQIDELEGKTA